MSGNQEAKIGWPYGDDPSPFHPTELNAYLEGHCHLLIVSSSMADTVAVPKRCLRLLLSYDDGLSIDCKMRVSPLRGGDYLDAHTSAIP